MQTIQLNTIEDAIQFLENCMDDSEVEVQYGAELKTLEIEIEGPKYHGAITGELARGLAEFQEELYRAALFSITGKTGREVRLSAEQKKQLELQIEVHKGCSLIKIDTGEFSSGLLKIIKESFENMSTKEQMTLVVSVTAIIAFGWLGGHYTTEHFKSQTQISQLNATNEAINITADANVRIVQALNERVANNEQVKRFAEATTAGMTQIAVRATDATSVKIGRLELDKDDLSTLRKRAPKTSSETLHETGNFRILSAESIGAQFKLTLSGASRLGGFSVEYDKSEFSEADDLLIWNAIRNQTEVRLEVKAEQLREKIKGAVIVNINPQ